MEKDLKKDSLNPDIVKKLMEVREVNAQLSAASGNLYESIIQKQIAMNTGSLLCLSED